MAEFNKVFPVVPEKTKTGGYDKKPIVAWSEESNMYSSIEECKRNYPKVKAFGMPTGERTGYMVVDIDNKKGHYGTKTFIEILEQISEEDKKLVSNTYGVVTPNKGAHLYFRYKKGLKTLSNIADGIDIRTDGGYIMLPGSVFPTLDNKDGMYQVQKDVPIIDMPDSLFTILQDLCNKKKAQTKGNANIMNRPQTEKKKPFVDKYAYLNTLDNFKTVLQHYNIEYTEKENSLKFSCPGHEDKNPSAGVATKDGTNYFFKCFSCDLIGNMVKFVSLIEDCTCSEAIPIAHEILQIPYHGLYGQYFYDEKDNKTYTKVIKKDKQGNIEEINIPLYEGELNIVQRVIDVKNRTYGVEIVSTFEGDPITKVFDNEEIFGAKEGDFKKLFTKTYGFHCYSTKGAGARLQQFLDVQLLEKKKRNMLPTKLITTDIGIIEVEGDKYIVYPNTDECLDTIYYKEKTSNDEFSKMFSRKGTTKDWIDNCLTPILNNDNACAMVLSGFASTLIKLLDTHENFMVQLNDTTGTGKSTVLKLVCSIYGKPHNYIKQWHGTPNAILSYVASMNTYPTVLEDLMNTSLTNEELQKITYDFSTGSDKMRLDKNSNMKDLKQFNNIIITTGETNILDMFKTGQGAFARVVSLQGAWEKTQENKQLTTMIIDNTKKYYGTVGYEWTKYLVELKNDESKLDDLKEQYLDMCNILATKVNNLIAKRVANHIALLYIAANLLEDFLGQDYFNYEDLIDRLLISVDDTVQENDLVDRAYMELIQYFRFKIEFSKVKVNREVVGEYFADYPNRTKDTIENYIGINNADLKKVIKELGYNASDILNSMKEREYIWTDRKGFSKVMNSRIDNKKVKYIVLRLAPYENMIGEEFIPVDDTENPHDNVVTLQLKNRRSNSDNTGTTDVF